ncbi:MAG: hypothetical protein IPN34_16390 [Planctomycetes bacterium]|nr:hypothetical protein [Planctomycetota bacterium]
MRTTVLWSLGLASLLGIAALAQGLARSSAQEQEPKIAINPDTGEVLPSSKPDTLLLTIGIDASGVHPLQAVAKKAMPFKNHRTWEQQPFRFTVRDTAGRELLSGGFDPAPMCLDPNHAGQPPHGAGDWLTVHETHTNVRVPDYGSAFGSIEFAVRDGNGWRPFGRTAASEIQVVR